MESWTGDDDKDDLSISSSGVVSFVTQAPDYENPADEGGNNVYEVTVDGHGWERRGLDQR